ncbi:MAG: PFL family protein [bacterium]
MVLELNEILETIKMVQMQNLDIRTVTMGISLRDCANPDMKVLCQNIERKILKYASRLKEVVEQVEKEIGMPIVNKRISVTPISIVADSVQAEDYTPIAQTLDKVAKQVGVDFLGGFSALVQKGFTRGDLRLIKSLPKALASTERVCASVNVGTTKCGINMDAVKMVSQAVKDTAELTREADGIGCAKFVVFCNVPEDNPFMAGAFHGVSEPEVVINVGVSGPGVVRAVLHDHPDDSISEIAEVIKQTSFKITRMGEMVGQMVSKRLGVPFGIVDLSLAPTPAIGDSIANILEEMGLERCGAHGTTACLAMLNDSVKKGGSMAAHQVGGLSGAFIPVSEDAGMIEAVELGALSLDKLEAMTCVCSVGLDMIAIPGDTPMEIIGGIIADEMAIGMINNKTTAVRVIPVPGKGVGEKVEFGGLLGYAPIMPVNKFSPAKFINRGGRIPAPIHALRN